MKEQKKSIKQLDKANEQLVALAHNVTALDRKESGSSELTVILYLRGQGKDLGTAIKLLKFFKGRIADRDKVLAA